jgi:enoyl-CoA hydratase/carnithine racemase
MLMTSSKGLKLTRERLDLAFDASSLEAAMAVENRDQLMCSRAADARDGMAAFMEKRSPVYIRTKI